MITNTNINLNMNMNMNMNITKIFAELDTIVRPIGVDSRDFKFGAKSYKTMVERFLKTAKVEMGDLPWSQIFRERLQLCSKVLNKERYSQYKSAIEFYIELTHESKDDKLLQLAKSFLDFLITHEQDTDSSLIGLCPSSMVLQDYMDQERILSNKFVSCKTLDDFNELKREEKISEILCSNLDQLAKGDIVVKQSIEDDKSLMFARYTGEKTESGLYVVWKDTSESHKERVPFIHIYVLPTSIKKMILSRDAKTMSKLVRHPVNTFYRELYMKTKDMTYQFLEKEIGADIDLLQTIVGDISSAALATVELERLATALKQLQFLQDHPPVAYYESVEEMVAKKVNKFIAEKTKKKLFLPYQDEIIRQILQFPKELRVGEENRLSRLLKHVKLEYSHLYKEFLTGKKKEELNDWILLHIEKETTKFLEFYGFDFLAVPDNYTDAPPTNLAGVARNHALLRVLMKKGGPLTDLVEQTRGEISHRVERFIYRLFLALCTELLKPLPEVIQHTPINVEKCLEDMREMTNETIHRFPNFSPDKIENFNSMIAQAQSLLDMTVEHETASNDVNDVTFGGLVVNVFVRLLEETKTAQELWMERVENTGFMKKGSMHVVPYGSTRLHTAVMSNNLSLAVDLITSGKVDDVNAQDQDGWSPLHCAAHNVIGGSTIAVEMMLVLLAHPVDVCVTSNSLTSPLHLMASVSPTFPDQEGILAILDLLVIKGAVVNQPNLQGEIPLHLACAKGNVNIVKYLLKVGSDMNAMTRSHQSCLHYAVHGRNAEIVKVLLVHGAKPDTVSPDGRPWDVAKALELTEIVEILDCAQNEGIFSELKI